MARPAPSTIRSRPHPPAPGPDTLRPEQRAFDLPVDVGQRRHPLSVDVSQNGLVLLAELVHQLPALPVDVPITATRSRRMEDIAVDGATSPAGMKEMSAVQEPAGGLEHGDGHLRSGSGGWHRRGPGIGEDRVDVPEVLGPRGAGHPLLQLRRQRVGLPGHALHLPPATREPLQRAHEEEPVQATPGTTRRRGLDAVDFETYSQNHKFGERETPVIICICRAVSDRTVRAAASAGARTVADVGRACGAGTGCGACRGQVAALLEDVRAGCPRVAARGPLPCRAHDAVPAEAAG